MNDKNTINSSVNENYTYEHKLKYSDLWRYSSDKLSLSFCISEFIDNSISSCEQTFWDRNLEHELKIDINYYKDEDKYEIIDNAGGMTRQELNDGMIFGNRKYDKWDNTHKNQYGIGMKSAIFWIGKDADIYTKKDGIEWCGKYHARGKNSEDSVIHSISISNGSNIENDSGTKIIIYGSNGSNRTMTNNTFNYVNFFLGNRYSRYLNDNRSNDIYKCTITINSKIGRKKIGGKVKKITISNNDTTKVYKYVEGITCKKSIEEIKILVENKIKTDSKVSTIKKNKFYDDFMYKLLNGKELIFEDTLVIPSYKDKNIKYEAPIKVYILERGDKYSAGVGIIHSNRYIFHPVLLDKERKEQLAGLYIPFDLKNYEDRGKWIRVDLDISKIQSNEDCKKISPEKNKTQLIFDPDCDIVEDDGNYGSSFKGGLKSVFFRWVPFITLMREISSVTDNKNKSENYENKEIGVISKDGKVEINLKIPNNEEKSILKEYYNNDENIKVIVEIIKTPNAYLLIENKNINVDSETGITTYKYIYNVDNQYFSNIKRTNDMSYILKLLLYLDIYYNQNKIKDKKVSEVINDALKFWIDE